MPNINALSLLLLGVGIASENDIAIYCNILFKYWDILQYIEQVSRIRKKNAYFVEID